MVNPIVLYAPPAVPVPRTSGTAVAPYQPSSNADPFAVSDAIDVQILPPNGDPRFGGANARWPAQGSAGPGWWNNATPADAASAYAAAGQRSSGAPPNGQLMDMSV
ncbi:MAG: hypothetical protein JO128_12370 [Alphaproteobacteria bacterium]|nr:hypothetical protein [Alphaproteobacteria bacterium]